jgi:hypothetical protein
LIKRREYSGQYSSAAKAFQSDLEMWIYPDSFLYLTNPGRSTLSHDWIDPDKIAAIGINSFEFVTPFSDLSWRREVPDGGWQKV